MKGENMEKINFVNGSQPAINATKLNALQTNAPTVVVKIGM